MRHFYIRRLFVAMVALLCSVAASAHDFKVDGIYYNISGDEAIVTYRGNDSWEYKYEYSGDVVIPSSVSYNGKNYSVTSIGADAFSGCSGLTSVEIPNSVTFIDGFAFSGCSSLTSITIPASVTWINDKAFDDCI